MNKTNDYNMDILKKDFFLLTLQEVLNLYIHTRFLCGSERRT